MNLYEYSQINNHEIGVKTENSKGEQEHYNEVLNKIRITLENDKYFQEIIERNTNYSMGKLFWNLSNKFKFSDYNEGSPELYQFFCNEARKITTFKDAELYQDKTAILRETQLDKTKYSILEKELKKLRTK